MNSIDKLAEIIAKKDAEIAESHLRNKEDMEKQIATKSKIARERFLIYIEKQLQQYNGKKVTVVIPTDVDQQTIDEILSKEGIEKAVDVYYRCQGCNNVFRHTMERMCQDCISPKCSCGAGKRIGSYNCDSCHDSIDRMINGGWS